MRPNIFVGHVENSAVYQKWYFEVTLDHIEKTTHMMPHLRIGWANTSGYVFFSKTPLLISRAHFKTKFVLFRYVPYPGGGEKWGGNGVGDDLYSFGFDGTALWTGNLPLP